jgi:hypothetical protein
LSTPQPEPSDPAYPVGDDVLVYRLIRATACKPVGGEWVFQSGAFDNATPLTEAECSEDMSVVLGDTLADLRRIPEALPVETPCAGDPDEWGVAVLKARFLRTEEEQELRRTPIEDEPTHGDVRGKKNTKRRRRLKQHAEWVVQPAKPPE